MIEDLPWEEFAGDPDTHIEKLEEKEDGLQKDLYKVRQELRLMRQIKRHKDTAEDWRRHGIPDQRQSADDDEDNDMTVPNAQGQTRKDRIRELMRQDPQRHWKAGSMAEALGVPTKSKSVRVTMDELMRAGELVKHPGSNYQHATGVRPAP
ncbi:hypothetical protein OG762_22115 [Streptomyces sp. NBC_01136]|uniref:hypothetical protein n=1 Tax=unclassified Streptomyces TaxID=2593676 RepID=UPI00324F2B24|nr:hypothetical protein OG762_22115 [Streptomyces sp. NBC_01136]